MNSDNMLLKVAILGDSEVGKTSLLQQYANKKFSKLYKSTIGADFETKKVFIAGQEVNLQIWDTPSTERFCSFVYPYAFYRRMDCCVLVYDITNFKSFENLYEWRQKFLDELPDDKKETFPFFVLGNKIDRETESQVSSFDAEEWCKKNGVLAFVEISCKNNTMVEEAFQLIAEEAKSFHKQKSTSNFKLIVKEDQNRGCLKTCDC